jgi:hypothetical protein
MLTQVWFTRTLQLAALLACVEPAVGSTIIPYFEVTDIGSTLRTNIEPNGINEDGAVVGTYDRGNGQGFL